MNDLWSLLTQRAIFAACHGTLEERENLLNDLAARGNGWEGIDDYNDHCRQRQWLEIMNDTIDVTFRRTNEGTVRMVVTFAEVRDHIETLPTLGFIIDTNGSVDYVCSG